VITLLILTLLIGAGTGAIFSTQMDLKTSGNLKRRAKAFYIAQAGLNHAWQELNDSDGTNDFATVFSSGATAVSPFKDTSFGSGSYTVTAQAVPGSSPKRIKATSTGCQPSGNPCPAGNSQSVIEAQFTGNLLFTNAAFGKSSATLSGGALTDSFDSRVGAYSAATAGSDGDVGSNGDITLSGGTTQIKGDATGGGTVTTSGGSTVTGTTTETAPNVTLPPVDSPCGSSFSDGTGITGGSYNSSNGQLNGTAGANITLDDGIYCLSSLDLSGGSTIEVNGSVTIYLTDKSDLSGGGITNTTHVAANLKIFSSYSSTSQGITVSGGSEAYMTIYAPAAKVKISGAGDFYGAVVGGNIDITGGAKFHYDKALEDDLWGPVERLTWKELF